MAAKTYATHSMTEEFDELGEALSMYTVRQNILENGFLPAIKAAKKQRDPEKYLHYSFLQGLNDPSLVFLNPDVATKIQEELAPDWEKRLNELDTEINLPIFHNICTSVREGILRLTSEEE